MPVKNLLYSLGINDIKISELKDILVEFRLKYLKYYQYELSSNKILTVSKVILDLENKKLIPLKFLYTGGWQGINYI